LGLTVESNKIYAYDQYTNGMSYSKRRYECLFAKRLLLHFSKEVGYIYIYSVCGIERDKETGVLFDGTVKRWDYINVGGCWYV
jgi:hypothetical protein